MELCTRGRAAVLPQFGHREMYTHSNIVATKKVKRSNNTMDKLKL